MNPSNNPQNSSDPAAKSLREILTEAMESAGLDTNTLSSETRLNKKILIDLIDGNYNNLPAFPYIRAFLMTLARRLKLNPEDLIKLFNQEVSQKREGALQKGDSQNLAAESKASRKTPVLIIITLFIILLFSLFSLQKRKSSSILSSRANTTSDTLLQADKSAVSDTPLQEIRQPEKPPAQKEKPPVQKEEPAVQKEKVPGKKEEPPVQKEEPAVQKEKVPGKKEEPPVQKEEPAVQMEESQVQKEKVPGKKDKPPEQKKDTVVQYKDKADSNPRIKEEKAEQPPQVEDPTVKRVPFSPQSAGKLIKNVPTFKCIVDSVWLNIKRSGKPDANMYLTRDQTFQVGHPDTITVRIGVLKGVEIYLNEKVYIPKKRGIKIFKGKLIE
jgi:cytoskeletal protein RodZ